MFFHHNTEINGAILLFSVCIVKSIHVFKGLCMYIYITLAIWLHGQDKLQINFDGLLLLNFSHEKNKTKHVSLLYS